MTTAVTPIDMRLSNAKAKTWRRCPKQFDFKYVQGWKPKERAVELERGSWIHDVLMHHYDGDITWQARHAQLTKDFYNLFEEEREDLGNLPAEIKRIMISYMLHWRDEDERYRTVDTELNEIITLPNGLRFEFIVDHVLEEKATGGLWLRDTKTVGSFMPLDFMSLDAQLTRYYWCAEHMGYKPLVGVEFNEIRTKAPTVPEVLKSGELTQRKNLDTDYITYLRAIRKAGLEPRDYISTLKRLKEHSDKWFRRTRLPKDKPVQQTMMRELVMTAREIERAQRTGQYPRTVDKSCVWMCPYFGPCLTELQGGDPQPELEMRFEQRKRGE